MRWQEINDDREKYSAYLCSREWSVLKVAVHDRAGGLCERCQKNAIDAVHHLTYARKYCERIDDLQALCNGCHEFTHGKTAVDPLLVEHREVKLLRVAACEGDLYVDCCSYVIGLHGSLAISIWQGACTEDQIREVVDRAIKIGAQMRLDHGDTDGQ